MGNTTSKKRSLKNDNNNDKGTLKAVRYVLKRRPVGKFQISDVEKISDGIAPKDLDLDEDQVLIEPLYLSVDAFIRTMLDEEAYHGAIKLGDTIPAIGVGRVVCCGKNGKYKVGALVSGMLSVSTHHTSKDKDIFPYMSLPGVSMTMGLGLFGFTTGECVYMCMCVYVYLCVYYIILY